MILAHMLRRIADIAAHIERVERPGTDPAMPGEDAMPHPGPRPGVHLIEHHSC
jgi:hypothetical protein